MTKEETKTTGSSEPFVPGGLEAAEYRETLLILERCTHAQLETLARQAGISFHRFALQDVPAGELIEVLFSDTTKEQLRPWVRSLKA